MSNSVTRRIALVSSASVPACERVGQPFQAVDRLESRSHSGPALAPPSIRSGTGFQPVVCFDGRKSTGWKPVPLVVRKQGRLRLLAERDAPGTARAAARRSRPTTDFPRGRKGEEEVTLVSLREPVTPPMRSRMLQRAHRLGDKGALAYRMAQDAAEADGSNC